MYRIIKKFNASHKVYSENMHAHTFTVVVYIEQFDDGNILFTRFEDIVSDYFEQYKKTLINETPSFVDTQPTIEKMCLVFYRELSEILKEHKIELIKLELSDLPTRSFSVGNKIVAGRSNLRIGDEYFQKYVSLEG